MINVFITISKEDYKTPTFKKLTSLKLTCHAIKKFHLQTSLKLPYARVSFCIKKLPRL